MWVARDIRQRNNASIAGSDFWEASRRNSPKLAAVRASTDHKALYASAAQMVLSPRIKAFDLESGEGGGTRSLRPPRRLARVVLLARRLVEKGVTFRRSGFEWLDTHDDNFNRVKKLTERPIRPGATLLSDLKERGMLDRTLVIWMGEFGRTPKINPKTGRDHYRGRSTSRWRGAGIKGGHVIGSTSSDGAERLKDRQVTVPDLFCFFYQALKINPRKENHERRSADPSN